MKRKVVSQCTNPDPSFSDAMRGRTYIYSLSCGHDIVGLPREVKGRRVHPKFTEFQKCK